MLPYHWNNAYILPVKYERISRNGENDVATRTYRKRVKETNKIVACIS